MKLDCDKPQLNSRKLQTCVQFLTGTWGPLLYKDVVLPVWKFPLWNKAISRPSYLYNGNAYTLKDRLYNETGRRAGSSLVNAIFELYSNVFLYRCRWSLSTRSNCTVLNPMMHQSHIPHVCTFLLQNVGCLSVNFGICEIGLYPLALYGLVWTDNI